MAFFLTELIRKSRLKKCGSRILTGFLPLKDIRSAVVIIDGTEPSCIAHKEKVDAFCKRNGIAVSFIYIDLRKKSKDTEIFVAGDNVVTRKDMSIFGIPKMKRKGALFTGNADLLVNFRDSDDFAGDFISKVCKARFKIGACDYPDNPFDLVVAAKPAPENEVSESDAGTCDSRTSEKIDAVCSFLKKIV